MGPAAFAVSERVPQGHIRKSSHQRQAERLPCRDRRTGKGYVLSTKEYADRQGVTAQLKADMPLEWVQRMNNIRNAVEEVINKELIYV